ncbi:MAG: Pr6Pr family membrane protein [Mycobacterium kyogaense]|uniref:Pr6Pr family membrane protein n=1 Tax=Mycobacterium kyogaense TaxID=2212479 RepID=UPI002FFCD615
MTLRIGLRVGIVLAVAAALLVVGVTSERGLWWRMVTFTYQVNVAAAAYYLWTLVRPRADVRAGLRGAVVLNLVMAGLVWNLFLVERSMGYTVANLLLHCVVPVLALCDWVLVGRRPATATASLAWWHPVAWLTFPAAYLVVALLVLNDLGRRAPYFFLDVDSVGAAAVATNVAALAVGVLALGYALLAVGGGVKRSPA